MIEQRRALAQRLARRVAPISTHFLKDVVLVEAWLPLTRKRVPVGAWAPLKFADDRTREQAKKQAERGLISELVRQLTENPFIVGPKGKLPA